MNWGTAEVSDIQIYGYTDVRMYVYTDVSMRWIYLYDQKIGRTYGRSQALINHQLSLWRHSFHGNFFIFAFHRFDLFWGPWVFNLILGDVWPVIINENTNFLLFSILSRFIIHRWNYSSRSSKFEIAKNTHYLQIIGAATSFNGESWI